MSGSVEYPDDFIDDVLIEFAGHPDLSKMKRLLEAGDLHALGKLLHEARLFDNSVARIHRMLYEGRHKELEREAAIVERRELIYTRWYAFYTAAKKS